MKLSLNQNIKSYINKELLTLEEDLPNEGAMTNDWTINL